MPYIKREEYNRLLMAGNALGNTAYNYCQWGSRQLKRGDLQALKGLQQDWDKAKEGLPKLRRPKIR